MSFYDFLKDIQKRPEREKKKLLVGLTLVTFLIVGTLWVVNIRGQFKKGASSLSFELQVEEEKSKKTTKKESENSTAGPFESLGKGLALFVSDIRDYSVDFLSKTNEILSEGDQEQNIRPVYRLPVASDQ